MATTTEPQETILAFNLPELLAVDLERSPAVSRSGQITSGAPAPSVKSDGSHRRYSLQDMSLGLNIPSGPRLNRTYRANSLRNIHQSYLPDLELNCNWTQLPKEDQDCSSPETPTSSESSFGCREPLSAGTIRTDITTPTTAASDLQPPPLCIYKNRISTLNRGDISWIDFDDEIEPIEEASDQLEMDSSSRRRGRVYDPRGVPLDSNLHREEPSGYMRGYERPRAFTNARARETSPFDPQRLSNLPAEIPQRQSSLGYTDHNIDGQAEMASHMSLPAHRLVTLRTVPDYSLIYPPTPTSDSEFDMKDESNATEVGSERVTGKPNNNKRPEEVEEETQESPSKTVVPAVNLEDWLKTTLESFMQYAPPTTNGPTTRMRLPAHVTDTLRISVSCFPETMLMCSSLSIETIRSHSRKLKTPPSSTSSSRPRTAGALLPDLPPERPKTPWYSKLAPNKSSHRLDTDQGPWASEPTVLKKMAPAAVAARGAVDEPPLRPETPCWAVIRSVFPKGTDFLCEALYAHIVAYNYITTLCPRGSFAGPAITTRRTTPTAAANIERASSPSPSSPEMRPQRIPTHDDRGTGTSIPNKAVNFLGMPGATNGPPEAVSPMAPMPIHAYLPPLPPPPEGNSRFSALRSKKSLQFLFKGEGNNNNSSSNSSGHNNGHGHSGRFNDNSSTESLSYGYSSGGSNLHLPSANHQQQQQTQKRLRNMNPFQQYQNARQRGGGGGGLKASATWAGLPNPSPIPNVPFFRRPSNQQSQSQSQSSSRPASSASSVASRRAPPAAAEERHISQQQRRQQQQAREKEREERDLRELRLGLARCVARLVATLRLACLAEGGAAAPAAHTQIDIDPLFMRALCELVRACEEKPVPGPDR